MVMFLSFVVYAYSKSSALLFALTQFRIESARGSLMEALATPLVVTA